MFALAVDVLQTTKLHFFIVNAQRANGKEYDMGRGRGKGKKPPKR